MSSIVIPAFKDSDSFCHANGTLHYDYSLHRQQQLGLCIQLTLIILCTPVILSEAWKLPGTVPSSINIINVTHPTQTLPPNLIVPEVVTDPISMGAINLSTAPEYRKHVRKHESHPVLSYSWAWPCFHTLLLWRGLKFLKFILVITDIDHYRYAMYSNRSDGAVLHTLYLYRVWIFGIYADTVVSCHKSIYV